MNTNLNNHNGTTNQYPDFARMQSYAHKSAKDRGETFFSGIKYVQQSIERLASRYTAYKKEQRAIKELSQLSPEMLYDIGITRNDVDRVQRGDDSLRVLAEQRAALMASVATASHARKQGLWLVDLKIKAQRDSQGEEARKVA